MRERWFNCATGLMLLMMVTSCRGEAVTPPPASGPQPAAPAPSVVAADSAAPGAPSASALPVPVIPSAASSTPPPPVASSVSPSEAEPLLLAADGSPLPQTEELPSTSSARFKLRMQQLADAILAGNGELARASFFPLVAYAQVKDVQKPERDYRFRLIAHFDRDVREYRKSLGKDAEGATFLGVDVPEGRAQWMKPGKEGNRLGYYRVLRSSLRFRLANGRERTFELTSMISWRGEWYVVHLHGFE